jgi:hypothetical protein
MSLELLYTSAPQGLKQGSRGFCTVISTVGMPINIAQKLESLSGYRHLYPPNDPKSNRNPVAYSHFRFQVGGRTVSLLSRIADYGLDYSQRTNKIAHHIVAETTPACGPAALMASPGVMRTAWDGQCETVATGPNLPQLGSSPEVCESWKRITGDAGWGGVVANAWMQPSNKPTWIVFSEEQSSQMLELIAESIAILPPSKRWQATFSTYVTTLPPDIDCRVRCVVAGSDEARMAAARGTVIDLTKQLGSPSAGAHVEAARNGTVIGLLGTSAQSPPGIASSTTLVDDLLDEPEINENTNTESHDDFDADNPFGNLDRIPPDISARPHQSRGGQRKWEKNPNSQSRKSKKTLYVIAGIIGMLVGLLGAGGTYLYLQTQQLSELLKEEEPPRVEPNEIEIPTPQEPKPVILQGEDENTKPVTNTSNEGPVDANIKKPVNEAMGSGMSQQKTILTAEMFELKTQITLAENIKLAKAVVGSVIHVDLHQKIQDQEIETLVSEKVEYQWKRKNKTSNPTSHWEDIEGANEQNYRITKNDENSSFLCEVRITTDPPVTLQPTSEIQLVENAMLRIPIKNILDNENLEAVNVTCELPCMFQKDKFQAIYVPKRGRNIEIHTRNQRIHFTCKLEDAINTEEIKQLDEKRKASRLAWGSFATNHEDIQKHWNQERVKKSIILQSFRKFAENPIETDRLDESRLKQLDSLITECKKVWKEATRSPPEKPDSKMIDEHIRIINDILSAFPRNNKRPIVVEDVFEFLILWDGGHSKINNKDLGPSFKDFAESFNHFIASKKNIEGFTANIKSKGVVFIFEKSGSQEWRSSLKPHPDKSFQFDIDLTIADGETTNLIENDSQEEQSVPDHVSGKILKPQIGKASGR